MSDPDDLRAQARDWRRIAHRYSGALADELRRAADVLEGQAQQTSAAGPARAVLGAGLIAGPGAAA